MQAIVTEESEILQNALCLLLSILNSTDKGSIFLKLYVRDFEKKDCFWPRYPHFIRVGTTMTTPFFVTQCENRAEFSPKYLAKFSYIVSLTQNVHTCVISKEEIGTFYLAVVMLTLAK